MIYLISNCTNAKRIESPSELILKNYNTSLDETVTDWKLNLKKFEEQSIIAKNLYKGPSWKATLDVEESFLKKFEVNLLISSAGYGLINSKKEITSYNCTFSKGNENSIYKFDEISPTKLWWNKINENDTKTFLYDDVVFVFVSYEYIIAMEEFLFEISQKVNGNLFIVTSSSSEFPIKLQEFVLQFDARFNSYEKGTFISLTQRCMRWLSNEIVKNNLEFSHYIFQQYINDFLSNYEKYISPKRIVLNKEELSLKIKNQILNDKVNSATQGLKQLRISGFACEQKRYSSLFNEIKQVFENE